MINQNSARVVRLTIAILASTSVLGLSAAFAQGGAQLETVVVTAQKREAQLQDVPLAVTAVTAEKLSAQQILAINDLQFHVPGLKFGDFLGQAQVNMRGHGAEDQTIGGDPSVGYHLDGVYQGRPFLVTQSFFDTERVEVLRGPQGTLFGRNNTGGTINVIPKKPTDQFEVNGTLTLGNYDQVIAQAAVNLPLSDTLSFRVAGSIERRDGYLYNITQNKHLENADVRSYRGILRWEPRSDLEVVLSGYFYDNDGTGPIRQAPYDQSAVTGASPEPSSLRLTRSDGRNSSRLEVRGSILEVNYDISDSLRVKSLTSFFHNVADYFQDVDETDRPLQESNRVDRAQQYSEELQLISNFDGPVNFVAGVFGYNEGVRVQLPVSRTAILDPNNQIVGYSSLALDQHVLTRSWALFGEIYYNVTKDLRLTAGGRYSADRKIGKGAPLAGNIDYVAADWDGFTPRFGADYKITDDVMTYVTISRGWKGGGMNIVPIFLPYNPETVWSREVGVKSEFFDHRARLNVSLFYDSLKNQQFIRSIPDQRLGFIVENAGKSTVYGAEIEAEANIAQGLSVDATASFLHATFDEFLTDDPGTPDPTVINLKGYTLPRSPKFTGTLGVQYTHEVPGGGSLTGRVQAEYTSKIYFQQFNELLKYGKQDGYAKVDMFLTYDPPDARWSVQAWVKNVTDKDTISNGWRSQQMYPVLQDSAFWYAAPPRTFGVTLNFNFGNN